MRYLLIAITIVGWSLWHVFNKIAVMRLHPIQMFMIASCVNVALFPLYYFMFKQQGVSNQFHIGSVAFCVLASISTAIGSAAYIYGIRTGELGTIAVLSCSYPLLTVLLSVLFLGESLTLSKIIGMIFVVAGVIVLGR